MRSEGFEFPLTRELLARDHDAPWVDPVALNAAIGAVVLAEAEYRARRETFDQARSARQVAARAVIDARATLKRLIADATRVD